MILVIVGFVVNLVLLTTFIAAIVTSGSALFIAELVVLVVDVLLAGIYFIYTWTNLKASPGQRILGMLTVSESDGSVLTFNQALARFVDHVRARLRRVARVVRSSPASSG